MRLSFLTFLFMCVFVFSLQAQIANTGMTDRLDSLEEGKVNINGYVDVYYAHSFTNYASNDRPYAVSSSRNNEIALNLGYIDIRYQDKWVRAKFTPAAGSYMNANYAAEPGTFKNIFEANAGVRLSAKKEIWLDAGILGSPFTNETPISKDHLLYTRSFAAENSPYYLSGIRLGLPLNQKLNFYFYLINGWQQIADVNKALAITTQLEYRPTDKLLLNWSNYLGDENSALQPTYGLRFLTDMYAIYKPTKKLSFTADTYWGRQETHKGTNSKNWWQANICAEYLIKPNWRIAARAEYFEDAGATIIQTLPNLAGLSTFSASAGINWRVNKKAMMRLEGRQYLSDKKVYANQSQDFLLVAGMSVAF